MPDIDSILFAILATNALIVVLIGAASAFIVLFDIKHVMLERIPGAALALTLSSLGAGALLWVADYLFVGG